MKLLIHKICLRWDHSFISNDLIRREENNRKKNFNDSVNIINIERHNINLLLSNCDENYWIMLALRGILIIHLICLSLLVLHYTLTISGEQLRLCFVSLLFSVSCIIFHCSLQFRFPFRFFWDTEKLFPTQ